MGGGQPNSNTAPALSSMPVQTSVYGLTIPLVYGKTRIPANLIWYGDFTSIAHTSSQSSGGKGGGGGGGSSTTYTYTAGIILAIGSGALTLGKVWKGNNVYADITAAGLSQSSGAIGQAVWGWLATTNPAQALGYSGLTYAYAPSYDLGSSASLENHSFEVSGAMTSVAAGGDVSPALVMQDVLANNAAFPAAMLGSVTAWDNYARAQGLLVSLAMDSQNAASEWLRDALDISHSDCVFSQGLLKFVPLGDVAVTGNGVSYTPNNTPVYDLTENVFITSGSEDPVTVEIKSDDDTYNCIKVEYTDRAGQYNLQVVEARDAADIDRRGLLVKSTVQAHAIHDAATANVYATLLLQMELGVRRTFKFKLPWTFALLEPLDLVTITDPFMGLYRVPARINTITEQDDGTFEVEAEDCPIGMTTAPSYGSQAGQGFAHDANTAAGNVTTPVFFEPPVELTTTGLEVWAAVSGANTNWGGCNVWASLDGLTYKKVDTIYGGARYGTTTTALAAGGASVGVALAGKGGTMLSASSTDAAQNASLCFVGTAAGGEFFNHVGAALTGTNAYTLAGLVRGAYGSTNAAHASGQQFVRVDDAIAKSEPLDLSMIGQLIHFKFTSFNVYGGGEQVISDVTDYTYTITGAMAQLPPSDVAGFQSSITGNGILLSWTKPADADYALTEIRYGADWATGTVVTRKASMTHLVAWQTAATHKYWARHEDKLGNQSATATSTSITIRAPNQVQMVTTEMQANALVMQWVDAKSDQPILRYEYFYGDAGAALSACVSWGSAGSDGRSDVRYFRTPGLKQIYVLAYDLAGNASTPVAFTVTSTMPTDFVIATDRYEDWQTSETTNTTIVGGANGQLLMPVADQTWGAHFSTRGWANAQAQVSAGYPLYWQPAAASGSHIERLDCGRLIAGGVINVGVTAQNLGTGAVGTVSIRTSSDATTWSAWVDSVSLQAPSFRYVETRYAVTSGGVGAILIDDIHVTVQLQTLTELANLTLVASDTLGTFYTTTKPFIDIQNVQVTPLNSPSIYRLNPVIKDDVAPFGVYVQAWDASNTRVSGTVSLSISGV